MSYIKLDVNNVVIYKTPYAEDGTIEALDSVVCGMIKVGTEYTVPNKPLDQVKAAQNGILTAAYNAAIQLPVTYMATTFQADDYSRKVLAECLAGDAVPTGFYWVDSNNVKVPMTYVQGKGLANAMLAQNQPLFNNLFTKKTAVRDALTVAAVKLVQW